jgi:hypothetical protein
MGIGIGIGVGVNHRDFRESNFTFKNNNQSNENI